MQLANLLVAAGRHAEGLDELLEIVRRDRYWNDDAARKTILAVFNMLGGQGELVATYRRKLASALDEMAAFFDYNPGMDVGSVARIIKMTHGKVGDAIMDKVAESLPLDYFKLPVQELVGKDGKQILEMQKAAKDNWRSRGTTIQADWTKPPFSLAETCVELCNQSLEARDAWHAAEKEAAQILPMALAGGFGAAAKGFVDTQKSEKDRMLAGMVDKLKENDGNLSKIRTETMMHNLLQSDGALRGYDRNAVVNAFNSLVDMAPHAMGQPLIAQSALRKQLAQQSLDSYDANELVKLDQSLGRPSGGGDLRSALMAAS
jgi:hypothetical protein